MKGDFIPIDLLCEHLSNPLGLDTGAPRLSWRIASSRPGARQTAYRILAATSRERLDNDDGDVWDTGRVASDMTLHHRYDGAPIPAWRRCYWKVKVWSEDATESPWSRTAEWSRAPGSEHGESTTARWISYRVAAVSRRRSRFETWDQTRARELDSPVSAPAVLMRREFELPISRNAGPPRNKPQATITVGGLGYYELFINGEKIGDHVLDPVFSDYQRRVHYVTYEVGDRIVEGSNAIGVVLGNGFYHSPTPDLFQMERANWKTPPKLVVHLHIESPGATFDLVTDASWRWSTGAIRFNSIRAGETVDRRRSLEGFSRVGFDDGAWRAVVEVAPPVGKLAAQRMPPMRITRTVTPIAHTEPRPGLRLFDFGENLTGWVELTARGSEGDEILLDHNEALAPDGTLDTRYSATHTGGRFQQDRFVCRGGGPERFEPRFTYHGFRYVQVEGGSGIPDIEKVRAKAVHTDLTTAGSFECSDDRLNRLHGAVRRTLLNSIHGMPGEEPTREKMGWTFDAGMATMESYLFNFHAVTTYEKYLWDLIDAQEAGGHIPPIVPTNGWGLLGTDGRPIAYDDPWWGGTIFYVASTLYRFTGDGVFLERAYDPMRRYLDFVASTARDGLIEWGLGDWLDMGQESDAPGPGLTPVAQTSTAALFWMYTVLADTARLTGRVEDAERYRAEAREVAKRFNATFLDPSTGWYHPGSQTAQALPLALGLVPDTHIPAVRARLVEAIDGAGGHISSGFIGVNPLLNYLSENALAEAAYGIVTREESPGWLHMLTGERATLGENLNQRGYGTGHHPFGACVGFWLYRYALGIAPDRDGGALRNGAGFKRFTLRPALITAIEWASGRYESLHGPITLEWRRVGEDRCEARAGVPPNTTARVEFPVRAEGTVRINGERRGAVRPVDLGPGDHRLLIDGIAPYS